MIRIERTNFGIAPGDTVIAEQITPEPVQLAREAARLHEAERTLSASFAAPVRREAFLAGRIVAHAALEAAGDSRAHRMPIIRDDRGRPQPTWSDAPAVSISHTKIRAVAAVALDRTCRALGIDVEEIDAKRAEALVRMATAKEERAILTENDPMMLVSPIAMWCAREACVKAHGLDVGWFGSVLRLGRMEPVDALVPHAELSWNIEIHYETRPPMHAHAWQSNGAVFAVSGRVPKAG
jgi:4'-phosphopantetheinyl transferase EntD